MRLSLTEATAASNPRRIVRLDGVDEDELSLSLPPIQLSQVKIVPMLDETKRHRSAHGFSWSQLETKLAEEQTIRVNT